MTFKTQTLASLVAFSMLSASHAQGLFPIRTDSYELCRHWSYARNESGRICNSTWRADVVDARDLQRTIDRLSSRIEDLERRLAALELERNRNGD